MVAIFKFLIIYIMPLFILIPFIAGIIKYKCLTLPLKLIFYLMIIYAILNGINSVLLAHHQPSKLCVDVLSLLDFPIISAFYLLILTRKWKIPIIVVSALYVIFWVADLYIETNSAINIYPSVFESIFIMLYAIVYMGQQTEANIENSWSENSFNWVNSGLLIYFASTLLFFTFYDMMIKMHLSIVIFTVLWSINNIAIILEFILIAIGFNKCRR